LRPRAFERTLYCQQWL